MRPGCLTEDLLLLWKHECDWVYGRRLIDSVDKERFQQAFLTAAKKRFTEDEQVTIKRDECVSSRYTSSVINGSVRGSFKDSKETSSPKVDSRERKKILSGYARFIW